MPYWDFFHERKCCRNYCLWCYCHLGLQGRNSEQDDRKKKSLWFLYDLTNHLTLWTKIYMYILKPNSFICQWYVFAVETPLPPMLWMKPCGEVVKKDLCVLGDKWLYIFPVNSLSPVDVIWRHWTWCLMAPSYYHYWLTVVTSTGSFGIQLLTISQEMLVIKMWLKNFQSKLQAHLSGGNELTHLPLVLHICVSKSGQQWFR